MCRIRNLNALQPPLCELRGVSSDGNCIGTDVSCYSCKSCTESCRIVKSISKSSRLFHTDHASACDSYRIDRPVFLYFRFYEDFCQILNILVNGNFYIHFFGRAHRYLADNTGIVASKRCQYIITSYRNITNSEVPQTIGRTTVGRIFLYADRSVFYWSVGFGIHNDSSYGLR